MLILVVKRIRGFRPPAENVTVITAQRQYGVVAKRQIGGTAIELSSAIDSSGNRVTFLPEEITAIMQNHTDVAIPKQDTVMSRIKHQ